MNRLGVWLLALAIAGASAGVYYARRQNGSEPQVTLATVSRGDIVDSVGAVGTLQAVTTVQVGTQVSGTISHLYADFNSIVRKGQVIARLDTSLFETQVEQARANLTRSESELERLRVALDDTRVRLTRARELSGRQLIPQSELDAADVAVRTAEAQLRSAEAQVIQSRAALNQSQVNLQHTVIEAPIDGIVISRDVDVGQTVAASMQAPTLFVLAADLTRMQVLASVDEADVGRIRPNQQVRFRVDAFPARDFDGRVTQVRLQPVVVQNVVTYQTVIDVPNPDLLLKPGMTANVTIEVAKKVDVVRVPNAALRFRPTADVLAMLGPSRDAPASGDPSMPAARIRSPGEPGQAAEDPPRSGPPGERAARPDPQALAERLQALPPDRRERIVARMADRERSATGPAVPPVASIPPGSGAATIDSLFGPLPPVESRGRVWLYTGGRLKPIPVRLGITDGAHTELVGGQLEPGTELVTGVTRGASPQPGAAGGQSPLLPQRRMRFGGR